LSRIGETFARLPREGRRGFIPFVTAGDPDIGTTVELIVELAHAGADIIELGVPFSDPVADGPVIQRASERALRNGIGVADVLSAVTEARRATDAAIVLFSYFNPLMQFGLERLGGEARRAGVDGVLVTDLVPEEAAELADILAREGLDEIFLVAPTSTDARLQMVAERASGFIYAVSRAGVTGARTELSAEAERLVTRVRACSTLPVAVGFGVTNREQVTEVWRYADAAVVGSAIVAEIEKHASERVGRTELVRRVGEFARSLLPETTKI
jgi:tryptophan synthase alpha chain